MDVLISRYGTSVLNLDLRYGIQLIKKAYGEKTNSMLWQMWLAKYPWMDKDSFISFEAFKKQMIGKPSKPKSPKKNKKEIISSADKIVKVFNKSREVKSNGNI